ncbi:MAG TPA: Mrp/NBP35 family ATP-binding protein, partial [Anaerolineae bacterium]|nr:Mrp/NBP35 family ATP-binding protein [Anaerolineae bacterium]
MPTEAQVREALSRVMDPELGRNIVELGMVRAITIDGPRVAVTLALTTMGCPLKDRISGDARAAVEALEPGLQVNVVLGEMTAEERQRAFGRQAPEVTAAQQASNVRRVLAVMSGKGGVGKSSVSALLAVALRRKGLNVGLLDADITGPSIPRMFGLHEPPEMGPAGMMPVESRSGIKVISINLLLPTEEEAVVWRGPLISSAIKQFWSEVVWGDLDVLILDLPPGTSDPALTVMQSIPLNGVLMVTSPQDLAGMVVRKAAQLASQLKVPIVGLVENMSYVLCPDCARKVEAFGP